MLITAIYAQLIVLGLVLVWFIFSKRRGFFDSVLKISTVTLLLIGLWLGGVWVYPPLWGLLIYAVLMFGLFFRHLGKPRYKTSFGRSFLSNIPVLFLALPLGLFMTWQGYIGRLQPTGTFVELQSPFAAGEDVCVLSGGQSELLNAHIIPGTNPRTLSQTHGLDFIALNPQGFRTISSRWKDPKPKALEAYAIYDMDVLAPCAGTVVDVENDAREQPIGSSDNIERDGNGVVLQCGAYHIRLSHLKQGSVLTPIGTSVAAGQKIGTVGNSGNTIEPHLHLHAETIVEPGNGKIHGRPVQMKINGKFLARGSCL